MIILWLLNHPGRYSDTTMRMSRLIYKFVQVNSRIHNSFQICILTSGNFMARAEVRVQIYNPASQNTNWKELSFLFYSKNPKEVSLTANVSS